MIWTTYKKCIIGHQDKIKPNFNIKYYRSGDSDKVNLECNSTGCLIGWGVGAFPIEEIPIGNDLRWFCLVNLAGQCYVWVSWQANGNSYLTENGIIQKTIRLMMQWEGINTY